MEMFLNTWNFPRAIGRVFKKFIAAEIRVMGKVHEVVIVCQSLDV